MRRWLIDQKDLFASIQSFVTIIAIFVGGWWTYRLFVQQRSIQPHVNLSHTITSKPIAPDLSWVHVTVTLQNTGDSLVSLRSADARIQQILPIKDASLQKMLTDQHDLVAPDRGAAAWPMLQRRQVNFEMEIEPKETDHFDFDFVIPIEAKTVRIYTYFENEKMSSQKHPIGWALGSIYDIGDEAQPSKNVSPPVPATTSTPHPRHTKHHARAANGA